MVDVSVLDIDMAFRVFILAIVQGIAEFLPISSSGHLLVLGRLFELPDVFFLSLLLHLGTLLAVLVFFARELAYVCTNQLRVIGLVIVGSIPTALMGFACLKYFPELQSSRLMTGIGFFITAVLLLTVMRRYSRTEEDEYLEKVACQNQGFEPPVMKTAENMTFTDAVIIGITQGLAVLPGLSRSGSTISTGALRGLKNKWSAEFSFYLSIPVIGGGALLEIKDHLEEVGRENFQQLFALDSTFLLYVGGAIVSFIVGWISLFYLMQMLRAGKLHYFAYWLLFMSAAVLCWTGYDHWAQIQAKLGIQPPAAQSVENAADNGLVGAGETHDERVSAESALSRSAANAENATEAASEEAAPANAVNDAPAAPADAENATETLENAADEEEALFIEAEESAKQEIESIPQE